jgi:DNA-binding NtrC family response regulator
MSANRSDRHAPSDQPVLILSEDAVVAALLGGLVETLGYRVQFARPPESADDSVRRVKPLICLVNSEDSAVARSEFLGRAAMRGVCIVIFGTAEALDHVRSVVIAHNLDTLLMPPELGELEDVLQRASAG